MPKGQAITREIATTQDGRDITRGYTGSLPLLQPQDTILLRKGGGDLRIYDELLRDDQVYATFQQRRLAVISTEWVVEAGGEGARDKKAADFLREQLEGILWDDINDKMLFGRFFGYAVAEILWGRDSGKVVIEDIRVRNRRRFKFAPDFSLRLITTNKPTGEELPEKKFWHFCCGADNSDEPYGLGLAHYVYWPVLFKRHGLKFWLMFLEKFGMPTVVGKYPAGASPEQKDSLLAATKAIQADSGVTIPEGMLLELLEAARSGTADYSTLEERMDGAISKVIVGQTMTADSKSAGLGSNQADVHMDVRQDLVKADGDLLCNSFNQSVAEWLTEWNFPGAEPPKVWRQIQERKDLRFQAYRDRTLAQMVSIPAEYIYDEYGIPKPTKGEELVWDPGDLARMKGSAAGVAAGGGDEGGEAAFSEPDAIKAQKGFAEQLRKRIGPEIDGWIDQVRKVIRESGSFAEAQKKLADLSSSLDTDDFADVMRLALVTVHMQGRYEVEEGS